MPLPPPPPPSGEKGNRIQAPLTSTVHNSVSNIVGRGKSKSESSTQKSFLSRPHFFLGRGGSLFFSHSLLAFSAERGNMVTYPFPPSLPSATGE